MACANFYLRYLDTIFVTDVGFKGAVVEVTKRRFRSELYPKGLAVYASPENLAEYEKYSQVPVQCSLYNAIFRFHINGLCYMGIML